MFFISPHHPGSACNFLGLSRLDPDFPASSDGQIRRALGRSLLDENETLFAEAGALADILGDVQLNTAGLLVRHRLCSNPQRSLVRRGPLKPAVSALHMWSDRLSYEKMMYAPNLVYMRPRTPLTAYSMGPQYSGASGNAIKQFFADHFELTEEHKVHCIYPDPSCLPFLAAVTGPLLLQLARRHLSCGGPTGGV